MSELNIFGLREYTRKDLFEDTTDEIREADRFYIMHEADAVIAEKDKEIAELKEFIENYRFDNKNMLHKIMNQDKKIRMLKRALYKACAMWADRTRLICSVFGSNEPKIRWERMLDKCRAMSERYMEGNKR